MEYKNEQNVENNIINQNNKIIETKSKSIEDIINKDDIIDFISSSFYSIINYNKTMKRKQSRGPNEPLYSKNIPVLSLNKFLVRIMKYTECENNTLIVAYLYIMKLIENESFVLGINNAYRLLLGAVVLAKKVLEDIRFNNAYYCDIGGISVNELNMIEYSLFTRINFDVNLKMEDVNKVYSQIICFLSPTRLNQIYQEQDNNGKEIINQYIKNNSKKEDEKNK
jgi:hypothetical protein